MAPETLLYTVLRGWGAASNRFGFHSLLSCLCRERVFIPLSHAVAAAAQAIQGPHARSFQLCWKDHQDSVSLTAFRAAVLRPPRAHTLGLSKRRHQHKDAARAQRVEASVSIVDNGVHAWRHLASVGGSSGGTARLSSLRRDFLVWPPGPPPAAAFIVFPVLTKQPRHVSPRDSKSHGASMHADLGRSCRAHSGYT